MASTEASRKRVRFRLRSAKEKREDEAYRRYLNGDAMADIASALGIAERQVYRYLSAAKKRMADDLKTLEGRAGIAYHFSVLNEILDEARAGWERSKGERTRSSTSVESVGIGSEESGAKVSKRKAGKVTETLVGDRAFLDLMRTTAKDIRELLGLDPPKVSRLLLGSDPVAGSVDVEALKALPPDELARRYQEIVHPRIETG